MAVLTFSHRGFSPANRVPLVDVPLERGVWWNTMRSRAQFLAAALILAICLVGQIAEIGDQWDHTLQTGNDTEYTFVVLALCAGVAYSLKWFVPQIALQSAREAASSRPLISSALLASRRLSFPVFTPASPPSAELRI